MVHKGLCIWMTILRPYLAISTQKYGAQRIGRILDHFLKSHVDISTQERGAQFLFGKKVHNVYEFPCEKRCTMFMNVGR